MKTYFFLLALCVCMTSFAQFGNQKFVTFSPLGLAEPQMAIPFGFGFQFGKNSSSFTELSYLLRSPFYRNLEDKFSGFRLLQQYRYHVLSKRWGHLFFGAEFRLKAYRFSDQATFVNETTKDTLNNFHYSANATSVGGGALIGATHNLSRNGKWQFELTGGFGVKQKTVHFRNLPQGFDVLKLRAVEWGFIPKMYESVQMPYVIFALRFCYRF